MKKKKKKNYDDDINKLGYYSLYVFCSWENIILNAAYYISLQYMYIYIKWNRTKKNLNSKCVHRRKL